MVSSAAFGHWVHGPLQRGPGRTAITAACRIPEPEAVARFWPTVQWSRAQQESIGSLARTLTEGVRLQRATSPLDTWVQVLLQEYPLSSSEGVALMSLAESLLRIPDAETRDALLRDKLVQGNWSAHGGHSASVLVNTATLGLSMTQEWLACGTAHERQAVWRRAFQSGGAPLVRRAAGWAMRWMGRQFVMGETIEQALQRAQIRNRQGGWSHSFDMLGEAALTDVDAQQYLRAYENAIHVMGRSQAGRGVYAGDGISIKLSALHPRYERAQYPRVQAELYPRLRHLVVLACGYGIGINLDAEESDRLELSLDLLERLCADPALTDYAGIGFVVQAYQKRCLPVVDHLIDLARRSGHRLMVRLVKGAYWDSEIKRAQVEGLPDYPVYTRKVFTDLSYLAAAQRLLAAPDAVYPQFATHNPHTVAAVYHLAGPERFEPGQYEFQCLHGMGDPLYEQVIRPTEQGGLQRPCRVYTPVGTHDRLLAYLVRRLLENGANTSFVHRVADDAVSLENLLQEPAALAQQLAQQEGELGRPNPGIPLPGDLYGPQRRNPAGWDWSSESVLSSLSTQWKGWASRSWEATPLLAAGDGAVSTAAPAQSVLNPADRRDRVGHVWESSAQDVEQALAGADAYAATWAAASVEQRAVCLERAADGLEAQAVPLMSLLVREGGKTCPNAAAEVREAVDFLRYYANQARQGLTHTNSVPLGVVACISPWNFPLAIFTGQVAAALAAGNVVVAKPAEQTPLVAAQAVQILWQAGVPRAALQLLPGAGEVVGAALVADPRVQGVVFTGSTEVARLLQCTLAQRLDSRGQPVTLIAETGGQNAMLVDSSALPEQVVQDALRSAFDSAGQRCSALRVLCVQHDVADHLMDMLLGALAEWRVGRPDPLDVDMGPVIDEPARQALLRHIDAVRALGLPVHQPVPQHGMPDAETVAHGTYVPPTVVELDSLDRLSGEVFGPVLHVLRFHRQNLAALVHRINQVGYGLTMGLHTRIDSVVEQVSSLARVGNLYVNRNTIGAVVGVQPFGGEGLSGTGPKAGGPLYLPRLLAQAPAGMWRRCMGDRDALVSTVPGQGWRALRDWAQASERSALVRACERFARELPARSLDLPGPTGERNTYRWQARSPVLCLAESDDDRLLQLAAVLAVGGQVLWPRQAAMLHARLPLAVQTSVALVDDWIKADAAMQIVLCHGSEAGLRALLPRLAQRSGPLVGTVALRPGDESIPLHRLVGERCVCTNTAAAGGNARLMSMS